MGGGAVRRVIAVTVVLLRPLVRDDADGGLEHCGGSGDGNDGDDADGDRYVGSQPASNGYASTSCAMEIGTFMGMYCRIDIDRYPIYM